MSRYWTDAVERVVWTAVEAAAGALLDVMLSGQVTWRAAAYAVGIAVLKVLAAKGFGDSQSAAAIPFVTGRGAWGSRRTN